jgi:hypothetical protein
VKLRAIPGRLWVALVVLGLLVLVAGGSVLASGPGIGNTILLGVAATVLLRLPHGHPFAHQCAFYIAVLVACVGVAMTTIVLIEPGRLAPGLSLLGSGALLVWGLGGEDVLRYFNLYCIGCGSYDTYQRGFLFKQIGCRKCGREWKAGELLDTSIFE